MAFIAKSDPIQTLEEHTDKLLQVMEEVKKHLSSKLDINWKLLKYAIIAHDLGKINTLFQERILKAINQETYTKKVEEVDHNYLSCGFIKNLFKDIELSESEYQILYNAVAFHHKHYLYYLEHSHTTSPHKVQKALFSHIKKPLTDSKDLNRLELYLKDKLNLNSLPDLTKLDYEFESIFQESFDSINSEESIKIKREYILIKGMLNYCDHLASMLGTEELPSLFFSKADNGITDDKIKDFLVTSNGLPKEDINFRSFQEKTAENLDKNIVTVAFTGSGKTIADYRWIGQRKFYAVPTRISAEAFYMNAELIHGEDKVGILHGDSSLYVQHFEKDADSNEISLTNGSYQLSKNLAKPYIISTIDQLATSIFKYPGYEKVLAALAGGKIIVDEVHLLTPHMYLLLLYLLNFLENNEFKVNYHLMSATIPNIYKEKLENLMGENYLSNYIEVDRSNKATVEIMYEKFSSQKKIKRFVSLIKENEKTLIVVNSIEHSIKLQEELQNSLGKAIKVNLIHSRFKQIDKKKRYKEILDSEVKGVWITTQLVEVALDIDFPLVISELSSMESVIQRMGRCNRHSNQEKGLFLLFNDTEYSGAGEAIYGKTQLKHTDKILRNLIDKKTKTAILTQELRKETLENYFETKEVVKEYENEFAKAEEKIFKLFDIKYDPKSQKVIKGEDLLLNIPPHINLTENKVQAQKLFRDGELSNKIILKSDYDELEVLEQEIQSINLTLKNEPENNDLRKRLNKLRKKRSNLITEKSIPISQSIYRKCSIHKLITSTSNGLLIIDDKEKNRTYEYMDDSGLVFNFPKSKENIL